jgi:hypothetical protein
MDPVPDPLVLRKFGSAGHRTRDLWTCSQELWPLDHKVITKNYKTLEHNDHILLNTNPCGAFYYQIFLKNWRLKVWYTDRTCRFIDELSSLTRVYGTEGINLVEYRFADISIAS